MKRLWTPKWLRTLAYSAFAFAFILVSACWYLGIRSQTDVFVYAEMSRECHPIWKDLALRRVYRGQLLVDAINSTPPSQIIRHNAFTTLTYQRDGLSFTGIVLIAKDDRLVTAQAFSCTWAHTSLTN